MTHRLFCFILFIGGSLFIGAQEATPPLDIPLKLSGTFGEFRATHFHAGLDLKTQGQEGFKVRAVQQGSVRRIRVATTGYGKCLYIQHANGTTSVYAHLQKFAPKIEQLIKAYQYEKQKFVVQRFLKLNELMVEEGEVIGFSGNTGGSEGPHLHFEIRDSKAETPLNPLRYGFDIKDSIRPIVQGLYRYALHDGTAEPKIEIPLQRRNDSVYVAELQRFGGTQGFGIRLFDRQDLSYNRNGIYKATLLVNGQKHFSYTFDKIDFSDGKKINALIDYISYRKERIRIQKLFRNMDLDFSFLSKDDPHGMITFKAGSAYQIEVIVEDFKQNKSVVSFYVEGMPSEKTAVLPPSNDRILPQKDYLYVFDQHEVYLPKETFYEAVEMQIDSNKDTLFIAEIPQPQRKGFEIKVKTPPALDSLGLQQLCLAKYDPNEEDLEKQLSYVWSKKEDGLMVTKSAYPGIYVFAQDSLAPSIAPMNFKSEQWMSNYKFLKVAIEDDFSGIKKYRATINDQWILMEYEPKDKSLSYDFSDLDFKLARLEFRLEVEDNVGNVGRYETTIFRKP
ncbi:MAG: M23 family metallopeptidase [Flavobacteriaceae bacterium]